MLTVECALPNQPFELPKSTDIVQVRTHSPMWQKERLLNIAIEMLPANCEFVAWLDCDVLFTSSRWTQQTMDALGKHAVVQLFDKTIRLARGRSDRSDSDIVTSSFMGALLASAGSSEPAKLGHAGYAWAARKDVLEACSGLYDACIIGGSDRAMAHAWFGDYRAPIVGKIVTGQMKAHYLSWAKTAHLVVRSRVSVIEGLVLHLWHGEHEGRQYFERHQAVAAFDFDPRLDLVLNGYGCWEWARDKPGLQRWIANYFLTRREDG